MRFVIEHAKRGQATCRFTKCKEKIAKGSLRIGKISSSPFAEGSEMTQWFHAKCLFLQMESPRATKLESTDNLEGFDDLSDEDKSLVLALIKKSGDVESASQSSTPGSSRGSTGKAKNKRAASPKDEHSTPERKKKEKKGSGDKESKSKDRNKKAKSEDKDSD